MKNTGIANWYADGSSTVMLGSVGGSSSDAYRFTQAVGFPMVPGTITEMERPIHSDLMLLLLRPVSIFLSSK